LEVSITFISGPHDVLDQILAPYRDQNLLANVSQSTFSFWQTFSIFASCTVIGVFFSVAFVTAE
jgi:hypothetical protein